MLRSKGINGVGVICLLYLIMACNGVAGAGGGTIESSSIVKHPAFDVLDSHHIKEYNLNVVWYKHRETDAQVLSIQALEQEQEKVYCAVFRTPISDSMGIPHILEHSVLLGSEKYPVRDIFTDLIKGSLYTFLNAFTYPDRTCYPVASVNVKDFYNLADVYTDVLLHPRAIQDELGLRQEGWRFDLANKSEMSSEAVEEAYQKLQDSSVETRAKFIREHFQLKFQGVVLNEMKGVYSSPDNLEEELRKRNLFPDMAEYIHDSGGEPKHITNLDFDAYVSFFKTRYNPSNAKFFFYGSDDVSKRLEFLDGHLSNITETYMGKDTSIGAQPHISKPFQTEHPYPGTPSAMEDLITISWVLDSSSGSNNVQLDSNERLMLSILSHLLVGTPASPLYKALTSSGLGKSVIGGGVDLDMKHATFAIGLKGVKQSTDAISQVESLVMSTLKQLADEGFDEGAIEASLNTTEFRLREMNTGTFPKGLALILQIVSSWNYDRSPFQALEFEAQLKHVRDHLRGNDHLFREAIRKYLLNNSHRLTFRLYADTEMENRESAAERTVLEEKMNSMSDAELVQLKVENEEIKRRQMEPDSPEALATLPKLTLDDVEKEPTEIPIEAVNVHGTRVLLHDLPTIGILYANFAFSLADLDVDDLPYLTLIARMLPECGTSKLSADELMHKIGQDTGGLSFYTDIRSTFASGRVSDPNSALGFFILETKCMHGKESAMIDLVINTLLDGNLSDQQRAIEIIKELINDEEETIQTSGSRVGAERIRAAFHVAGYAKGLFSGMEYLTFQRKLLEQATNQWQDVSARLQLIRHKLVRKENLLVDLTANESSITELRNNDTFDFITPLLSQLKTHDSSSDVNSVFRVGKWVKTIVEKNLFAPQSNQGWSLSTQVNYVCYGGRLANPGDVFSGSDSVVDQFLSNGYLWDNIRVLGGAYGAGSRYDRAGVFVFSSYRDPNMLETVNAYKGSAKNLKESADNMTELDLTRAIISVIRDLDAPLPSDRKGLRSMWQYLSKESPEDRRKFRNEVLSTKPDDFRAFAERLGKAIESSFHAVIVGSTEGFENISKKFPSAVTPVHPEL